ncbi:DUF6090 family protein [Flagellimonas sp. DF-77]|uniref:DUF6090 family protein n=1 Tax=Flagellimonas algarum TaxID=3230298 RepID=UPI00339B81EA
MLRFFTTVRRKLLSEGKSAQYLKYALGEIALVVIGILIALQINNWNEARKEEKALKEYLVKIKSHTQEDLRQLEDITVGRKRIADLCKKARNSILDKTEDQNLLLFMFSGLAFADYYFKPNVGGYEALKNSDYFGKINNTPLDSLLAKYHAMVETIAENEKSYNDYTVDQEGFLSTQYDRSLILASAFMPQDSLKNRATTQQEIDAAFIEYTRSAPYRNVISLAAFQIDAMVGQYGELSALGTQVISEIDLMVSE